MSEQNTKVRKIRRNNVHKAIELLCKRADKAKRKDGEEERYRRISSRCVSTPLNRKRRKTSTVPFFKNLAIAEMRSYMAHQDWRHMQHLFPLLLSYSNELEPLVWRYAMLILLYSPNSSSSNLDVFLEMCIGSDEVLDGCEILEKLLLPSRKLEVTRRAFGLMDIGSR